MIKGFHKSLRRCNSFSRFPGLKLKGFLVILAFFTLPFKLSAGWVITCHVSNPESKEINVKYFVDNERFKAENEHFSYACDFSSGTLVISNKDEMESLVTTFDQYITKCKTDALKRAYLVLQAIPDDQRQDAEKDLKQKANASVALPQIVSDSLLIRKMNDTTKICGYLTTKYSIVYKNQVVEQLSTTDKLQLFSGFDLEQLFLLFYLLDDDLNAYKYAFSPKYYEMFGSQTPLKRILTGTDGMKTEWLVENIEEKKIAEQEFRKPVLFRELTLDQWFKQGSGDDGNYYDDYE